jgi:hypothetical protein
MTASTAIYVRKEAAGFCIVDANSEKFHVWNGEQSASIFTWEQLLEALRTHARFQGRQIVPQF